MHSSNFLHTVCNGFNSGNSINMEVARISSSGQITIPVENGRVYFESPSLLAFDRIQNAMRGVANGVGFNTEQELQDYAREVRQEMWERDYAHHD